MDLDEKKMYMTAKSQRQVSQAEASPYETLTETDVPKRDGQPTYVNVKDEYEMSQ